MRDKLSLLWEAVRQWSALSSESLLVYDSGLDESDRPLEQRVLLLLRALHRAQQRGESRSLHGLMPDNPGHPLRAAWSDARIWRRQIRRLATNSAALQWLEEAPTRWEQLRESIAWLPTSTPEAQRSRALQQLQSDPRTAPLPPGLLLERLAAAALDAPIDPGLGVRVLDADALNRTLEGGARALAAWATEHTAQRQQLWLADLPAEARPLLQGQAPSAPMPIDTPPAPVTGGLPSRLLTADVIPLQGQWRILGALVRWCATPATRDVRLVVGPEGAGKGQLLRSLCDLLRAQGWAAGFMNADTDTHAVRTAGGDRLVILPDAAHHPAQLQAVLDGAASGRLRVVAMAEAEGAWQSMLPSLTSLLLAEIPVERRAARLRLAAAALAAHSGQRLPWVMAMPDLDPLRWPLDIRMAALATIDGRPTANPADGATRAERYAWKAAGLDDSVIAKQVARAALGAGPRPAIYAQGLPPGPIQARLVNARLLEDERLLHEVTDVPRAARLLDRLAENQPRARGWLKTLLSEALDSRATIALRVAGERGADVRLRPLGGVLSELGVDLPESAIRPLLLRSVSIQYSRQVLGGWREVEPSEDHAPAVAVAANERATRAAASTPSRAGPRAPLAEQVWDLLRARVDVVLPHQVRALELLDQDHRGSPHESLARQRIELMVELCVEQPASFLNHLEGALNDLGALLSAGQLQPETLATASASLTDDERQQARAAARSLDEAAAHRGRYNSTAAVHALSEATRLLRGLSQRHPTLIASDLLHATLEMAVMGRRLGRTREAAATLQALLGPLDKFNERYPLHWPRRSTILSNLALIHLAAGRHAEARTNAKAAVEACPPDHAEAARIDRITAQHVYLAVLDATTEDDIGPRWEQTLTETAALAEAAPALHQPYLVTEYDRAARWRLSRGEGAEAAGHVHNAVEALRSIAALDTRLYAPFEGLSLHNLGARLRSMRAPAALDVTLDAAEAFRRQARVGGETFLPDLARTLSNLGAMLIGRQRPDQAMALSRKSIGVCWGGVPAEALAQMPRVERLLAAPLPPIGRPSPVLVMCERMVEGHARQRPYFLWHLSLLAAALTDGDTEGDLSDRLAQMWRFEVARPESLRPGLASALHNLGAILGIGEDRRRGAEAMAGAVAVLRALSMEQPVRFRRLLAMALIDQSALVEEPTRAEDAAREALSLLADDDDGLHAQALLNHSAALCTLGQHDRATVQAAKAATLAEAEPDLQAAALHNLALAALAAGRVDAAYAASRDALRALTDDVTAERRQLLVDTHRRCAERARREPETL